MLMVAAGDLAKGDYSPIYGTVTEVIEKGKEVTLKFLNQTQITLDKDEEIEMQQGGRFDREP